MARPPRPRRRKLLSSASPRERRQSMWHALTPEMRRALLLIHLSGSADEIFLGEAGIRRATLSGLAARRYALRTIRSDDHGIRRIWSTTVTGMNMAIENSARRGRFRIALHQLEAAE